MKSYGMGLLAMLILASGSGCEKSASEGGHPQSTVNPQPSTTLARVHWLGKKRIAAQKTSSYFMSIWNMPEAARLETQTLDKLALAMVGDQAAEARLSGFSNQGPVTSTQKAENRKQKAQTPNHAEQLVNRKSQIVNPQALLLRPLLDDLVREESYLEIQQATNHPAELVLAVRLDDPRAELWTSNLSTVVGAMTNVQALPAPASRLAWRLSLPSRLSTINHQLSTIEMARAGDWTLLGMAAETNGLLAKLCHRILLDHTPVAAPEIHSSFQADPTTQKAGSAPDSPAATNHWLQADLDLRGVSGALSLGWNLPDAWPRISATWTGNRQLVRTTGELTFPKPLNLQLEPWNIPTDLIHQPLVSFTAVRGVRPWLARQKWLQHFQIEPVPDQFCSWASGPTPMLTFAATPVTNAAALLQTIGPRVAAELNPWITNNAMGQVEYSKEPAGLAWSGIPMFTPTIEAPATPGGGFLVGRLGPPPPARGKPAPPELFAQLTTRTNLVYYDWEITQAKLGNWIYHGQTARLAFVLPQMLSDSAALAFLLAVAPKLGNTGTDVIQDGPASLSFVRNSHCGFTGVELHLLADWLESPAFPRGLHSLLAPRPVKKIPPPHRPHSAKTTPSKSSRALQPANPVRPPP
ncbi:MAG: hypothetical protein ACLQU3_29900 [Limisphaerales bacterium]